jgi:hypothetical protein
MADTVKTVRVKFTPEEIAKRGGFTMKLRSYGNPDFGQYAPVSERETATGMTLTEMREKAMDYRGRWELGGGNWGCPVVKLGTKIVGHFSYNGRFWQGSRPGRDINDWVEILIDQDQEAAL